MLKQSLDIRPLIHLSLRQTNYFEFYFFVLDRSPLCHRIASEEFSGERGEWTLEDSTAAAIRKVLLNFGRSRIGPMETEYRSRADILR